MITKSQIDSVEGLSSRQAAKVLGTGKTAVNKYRALYARNPELQNAPKILTIDIESKPLTAYVWGIWDQNVGLNQIVAPGGMICFAAKWLGDDEVLFYSTFHDGYTNMLKAAWDLLSEADIVVSYNGDRYDFKRMNNEFLLAGMTPPKPYRSIDLLKTNRNKFDLPSRKLDYLVQSTGVGAKVKHEGFDLWVDCMANDPAAWAKMKEYNIGDVIVTEGAYLRILPWLANPPHYGMFIGETACCAFCGSKDLIPSGVTYTNVQGYNLFQCGKCGGWVRDNTRVVKPLQTKVVV